MIKTPILTRLTAQVHERVGNEPLPSKSKSDEAICATDLYRRCPDLLLVKGALRHSYVPFGRQLGSVMLGSRR